MSVAVYVVPSDVALLSELERFRADDPAMGVQRLAGQVHDEHPDWRVNSKRIRRLLKANNMMLPSTPAGSSPCCVASPLADLVASSQSASDEDKDCKTSATDDELADGGGFIEVDAEEWLDHGDVEEEEEEEEEEEWVLVPPS